jgi:bacterial/archaeal transporter family protein
MAFYNWQFFLLLAVTLTAGFNVLIKLSADKIQPVLGFVIMQAAAFIVSLIILGMLKDKIDINLGKQGLLLSVAAGVLIAIVNISIYYMYHLGGTLSVAGVIGRLAPALLVFVIGLIFFAEGFSYQKLIGFIFSMVGIFLLMKK